MTSNKILLINPRQHEMLYVKMPRDYFMYHYPPLGLMYLSGILEKNGYATEIIDTISNPLSEDDLVAKLKSEDFLFIGFYSNMITNQFVIKYCEAIRRKANLPIVVGGPSSLAGTLFLRMIWWISYVMEKEREQ